MDLDSEFDHAVSDMKWGEVISTLESVVEVLFGDMSSPSPPPHPPPPPPPPPRPLPWPRYNLHPQLPGPLSEGYFQPWHIFQGANPLMSPSGLNWNRPTNPVIYHKPVYDPDYMWPCYFYRRPDQQLLYIQPPVNYIPINGAESYPSPLSYPYDGVSVCSPSIQVQQERPPVEYRAKRRSSKSRDKSEPYVKKPLNAFMLFMKEQRAKLLEKCDFIESAVLAKSLGHIWASMSNEQKDKYFKQSQEESRLHSIQHPNWTPNNSYEKKGKRIRSQNQSWNATETRGFAFKHGEVTPAQTAAMEGFTAHSDIKLSPQTLSTPGEPPQTHSAVTSPVCNNYHLPQMPDSCWPNSSTNASAELPSLWTRSSY